MEDLIFVGAFFLLCFLYGYAVHAGWLPNMFNPLETLKLRIYKKALSERPCPSCGSAIGEAEASEALERAWKHNQQRLMQSVAPEHYDSWPVVCPACSQELTFWTSEKVLRRKRAGDSSR